MSGIKWVEEKKKKKFVGLWLNFEDISQKTEVSKKMC